MVIKDKLPVSYLLFTNRGRISRMTYLTACVFIWCSFYILFTLLDRFVSYAATCAIYPLLFWALYATATKRLHDGNRSGYWLLLILVPVLGPMILFFLLGFKKGSTGQNRYGANPLHAPDYFKNNTVKPETGKLLVNDVTQLNPVFVSAVETPENIGQLQSIIKNATTPISIGGGRFSMGGQTASADSLHIDMRKLNKIIHFSAEDKTIKVEAGIRWCDIQHEIDKHDLSIKIMQTYANFTVGGALSVNCHGRYIGLGPVILSVKAIEVILANGDLAKASKTENPDLFFAVIGCYNAIAAIATVLLELEENVAVERFSKTMKAGSYWKFFKDNIRDNKEVVFHNGDIYPPLYQNVRAVS